MYSYMALGILLFQVLVPLKLVIANNFSTRLEYKITNSVPQEYHAELKDFELIGEKHYFIANKVVNWFQAAQECRQKGGYLINLSNNYERVLVGMRLNVTEYYWLDINRLGQDAYVSITTGVGNKYQKWLEDGMEKPHDANEPLNCVLLVNDYEEGFVMKKAQCLEKASYICQRSSPSTISIVVW